MIIRRLKEMWPWRPVCETSTSAGGWGFDFGLFNRLHAMLTKQNEHRRRYPLFLIGEI